MPMQFTDDQLLSRVESHAKGCTSWRKGLYFICVRSKADKVDAFDDKGYLFECKTQGQRPDFAMVVTCTTNAGTYGLKEFHKYEPKGCAVLEADRIVYDSHAMGRHKTYTAYRQVKGFPYYRDADKDDRAEETGPVQNNIIFANIHRASPDRTSTRIYNWSVACMVMNQPNQFKAFMAYCDGRPVSLCILREF
jgi:hypothetical protein